MAKFIWQAGVFFKRPLYAANTSTQVSVYNAETGLLAPIWNDRDGSDPRANPGAIWAEGQIRFYANPGRYTIIASNPPDERTWPDVIIVDPDAVGGGGGADWGNIGGTLSDQTDLQATLNAKAALVQTDGLTGYIGTVANTDYRIAIQMPFGGTILSTTTQSVSGTCTATFKINTTALGGTANSVSSTEQEQTHASVNAFSAGDNLVMTVSSNSACLGLSFMVKFTRSLAA